MLSQFTLHTYDHSSDLEELHALLCDFLGQDPEPCTVLRISPKFCFPQQSLLELDLIHGINNRSPVCPHSKSPNPCQGVAGVGRFGRLLLHPQFDSDSPAKSTRQVWDIHTRPSRNYKQTASFTSHNPVIETQTCLWGQGTGSTLGHLVSDIDTISQSSQSGYFQGNDHHYETQNTGSTRGPLKRYAVD